MEGITPRLVVGELECRGGGSNAVSGLFTCTSFANLSSSSEWCCYTITDNGVKRDQDNIDPISTSL
jgi:hypothetical protein